MTPKTTKPKPKRPGRTTSAVKPRRRRLSKSDERALAEVAKIARRVAAAPVLHDVDPDTWLYDERGLPH